MLPYITLLKPSIHIVAIWTVRGFQVITNSDQSATCHGIRPSSFCMILHTRLKIHRLVLAVCRGLIRMAMSRQSNKRVVAVIRPPLIVIGAVQKHFTSFFSDGWMYSGQENAKMNLPMKSGQNCRFYSTNMAVSWCRSRTVVFPCHSLSIATVNVGAFALGFARGRGELDVADAGESCRLVRQTCRICSIH